MSIWKIAWRSIQYRGLGSILTVLSMSLGVMMIIAVLTVDGVLNESFRNNSSFGYNLLLGARGGGLQLTLNSVYYLSQPIETIPYEYYLVFAKKEQRAREFRNSIAWNALERQRQATREISTRQALPMAGGIAGLMQGMASEMLEQHQRAFMDIDRPHIFAGYTDYAIPILLGDYYELPKPPGQEDSGQAGKSFRVCGTNSDFFSKLVLNYESQEKISFAEGRAFELDDPEAGFFGCVLGATVARESKAKLGDKLVVTHGVPGESSHLHENQPFTVVGIMDKTGTPHDRVVFVNMEGFFMFSDHVKPVGDESFLANRSKTDIDRTDQPTPIAIDERELFRQPIPVEQRELTSILLATVNDDGYDLAGTALQPLLEQGDLERTLKWSSFRPVRSQTSVQAVNPIGEITQLFTLIDPAKWLLLGLTVMICMVSGLSILVGIYNSMSQRHHEIAVMRALGANRSKIMRIVLGESVLLSVASGLFGWIAAHVLNWVLTPMIESQTGVTLGFWKMAPGIPILSYLPGNSLLPPYFLQWIVSPELLLIPGLVLLAVMVGIYPAISAYRTDVSRSLGK